MPSPEEAAVEVPEEPYTIPFGQAKIVREGGDITIVTASRMVYEALVGCTGTGKRRNKR